MNSYNLETASLKYGDFDFLAHNKKGETTNDDRYFFAQRIPSYGIINFGAITADNNKRFTPISDGIESDIMLRAIYDFTTAGKKAEVTWRLFQGNVEILEQRIANEEMPYEFPPGAIIDPNLTIELEPNYTTNGLLICWQPVHVLNYIDVN